MSITDLLLRIDAAEIAADAYDRSQTNPGVFLSKSRELAVVAIRNHIAEIKTMIAEEAERLSPEVARVNFLWHRYEPSRLKALSQLRASPPSTRI